MAAPEPEVVCPAAVPGKAWGPEIGEPLSSLLAHGPFSGPSSLTHPSWLPLGPSDSIAPWVLDPIGSSPLGLPFRGVLDPA